MSETDEAEGIGETQTPSKENITISRAPNFAKYYATNVKGGLTNQDFRYQLMNEKFYNEDTEEWLYIVDALIILSPIAAKKLLKTLENDINTYEAENGIIQTEYKEDLKY